MIFLTREQRPPDQICQFLLTYDCSHGGIQINVFGQVIVQLRAVSGYQGSVDSIVDPYNQERPHNTHHLRNQTNRIFNDSTKLKIAEQSFNIDAAKLWNNAPEETRTAATIEIAKRAIKIIVKTFPI